MYRTSAAKCARLRCSSKRWLYQPRARIDCKQDIDDETWTRQLNDEMGGLLSSLDIPELEQHASTLRAGVACKFRPSREVIGRHLLGCANYHAFVDFVDGVQWLVRIPRKDFSDFPDDLVDYLVESEFASLKNLRSIGVPAPRVHGYRIASESRYGTSGSSYILMDRVDGKPYDSWTASQEVKQRVMDGVADVLITMSKNALPQAGSLVPSDSGSTVVSACASTRFVNVGKLGPFQSDEQYYTGYIHHYLDLIADGQLYVDYPDIAFRFYHTMLAAVPSLCAPSGPPAFYIKHVDDKGDHIMINNQGIITGIIDWQFARCVPSSEAFGASYLTANMEAIYAGRIELSEDDRALAALVRDKGHPDLAALLEAFPLARTFGHGMPDRLSRDEAEEFLRNIHGSLRQQGHWKEEMASGHLQDKRWPDVLDLVALTAPDRQ
ncbi:hypothetical protein KVT40_008862 [Elsinoe batatas]|uniref:Aminoglycoside phosphotransferase domain-containing protein n=1 Tax=Elsinoe batatas TaxID=2601811 RepID=A0A8K0KXQ1_9PEZI|nr:hypothetical protein KVT40_008862 [Elsinoe batatas]